MRLRDDSRLRLWCFLDGKPGHQNQTLGLVDALRRCGDPDLAVQEIVVPTRFPARLLGPSWRSLDDFSSPHLIIGAGHATHVAILRARRRFGGSSVVLMKPSLPVSFFDLCIIPDAHSIDPGNRHVMLTRGVLNRIQPSLVQDPNRGLVLIGGPSQHFQWSNAQVISQLRQVLGTCPARTWTVATSRRTPASFIEAWEAFALPAKLVPQDSVTRDWLPRQIAESQTIWVTEDSVSMTYEAVTSGAAVGTIELPRPRLTRVTAGMDRLVEGGYVTPWSRWARTGQLAPNQSQFREADRAAEEILRRFCPQFASTASSPGVLSA